MLSRTLFHIVNVAGGLALDPRLWERRVMGDTDSRPVSRPDRHNASLADAAEQLRRASRYAAFQGASARLLANALKIVEAEIVERELAAAQRKSRSMAINGLSAGGIG